MEEAPDSLARKEEEDVVIVRKKNRGSTWSPKGCEERGLLVSAGCQGMEARRKLGVWRKSRSQLKESKKEEDVVVRKKEEEKRKSQEVEENL